MKSLFAVLILMALVVLMLLAVAWVSEVVALFDALDDAVLMSVAAGGRG